MKVNVAALLAFAWMLAMVGAILVVIAVVGGVP